MSTADRPRIPGHSPSEIEYEPFERVHDTDDPDGTLVVLRSLNVRASKLEMADGIAVSDVYPDYPDTDAVVVCVYEHPLERAEPNWPMWNPEALADRLDECGVDLRYYPSSKLERYDAANFSRLPGGTIRCEFCSERVGTSREWVTHVVRQCPDR